MAPASAPASVLDGRSRLAGALALCIAAAVCHSWYGVGLALACGLASLTLGWDGPGPLLKRMAFVNLFFLGLLATVPFALPGKPLFHMAGWPFSREGLALAALMTAKGNAILLMFWGLVRPLSPAEFGAALSGLGMPDKLCLILALTARYLELMRREWDRLLTAARLRGFDPGTSRRAWSTYALLLALLIIRAMDRAGAIHQAMLCRGFDGRFRSLGTSGWRAADTALCLGCAVLACAVLFTEAL